MRCRKVNLLLALVISPFSLVTDCGAQRRSEVCLSGEAGKRRDRGVCNLAHRCGADGLEDIRDQALILEC